MHYVSFKDSYTCDEIDMHAYMYTYICTFLHVDMYIHPVRSYYGEYSFIEISAYTYDIAITYTP